MSFFTLGCRLERWIAGIVNLCIPFGNPRRGVYFVAATNSFENAAVDLGFYTDGSDRKFTWAATAVNIPVTGNGTWKAQLYFERPSGRSPMRSELFYLKIGESIAVP